MKFSHFLPFHKKTKTTKNTPLFPKHQVSFQQKQTKNQVCLKKETIATRNLLKLGENTSFMLLSKF